VAGEAEAPPLSRSCVYDLTRGQRAGEVQRPFKAHGELKSVPWRRKEGVTRHSFLQLTYFFLPERVFLRLRRAARSSMRRTTSWMRFSRVCERFARSTY
jgi:hypothetical protein